MASRHGSGHSIHTAKKQDDFASVMRVQSRIAGSILGRCRWAHPKYHYFDINAGSGSEDGHDGSPIIALKILADSGMAVNAWLFEKDLKKTGPLRARIDAFLGSRPDFDCDCRVVEGDHADTVPGVLTAFAPDGPKVFGLVYSDPYGRPSFEVLRRFTAVARFERLDILTYLNATAHKRLFKSPLCWESRRTEEYLRGFGKATIHVREYVSEHQWSFGLCTNMDQFPRLYRNGFRDIETAEGRQILTELNLTNAELASDGIAKRVRLTQKTFLD